MEILRPEFSPDVHRLNFLIGYYNLILKVNDLSDEWRDIYESRLIELIEQKEAVGENKS